MLKFNESKMAAKLKQNLTLNSDKKMLCFSLLQSKSKDAHHTFYLVYFCPLKCSFTPFFPTMVCFLVAALVGGRSPPPLGINPGKSEIILALNSSI